MEHVILVDEHDREIGTEEKLEAHRSGKLHRAFSIFLFNEKQEMLIQQRAHSKYHSGGQWSNACCSHPRPGEDPLAAATRRLKDELGIQCGLQKAFHFIYKAPLDHQLIEHEFDHVFVGHFDGEPELNPCEVNAWRWIAFTDLEKEMSLSPGQFTYWFKVIWRKVWTVYLSLPDQPNLVRSVEK